MEGVFGHYSLNHGLCHKSCQPWLLLHVFIQIIIMTVWMGIHKKRLRMKEKKSLLLCICITQSSLALGRSLWLGGPMRMREFGRLCAPYPPHHMSSTLRRWSSLSETDTWLVWKKTDKHMFRYRLSKVPSKRID